MSSSTYSCLVFPAPLIEETVFSPKCILAFLCCRLIDHWCVGLFLGSLLCSIDLCVCFCAGIHCLITVAL